MSDDLGFIDDMLKEGEAIASRGGNSKLNVVFLGEQDFTMRIVLDKNKKLCNEFRLYTDEIKTTKVDENGEEKEVKQKIKYRAPMKWEDDIVNPYAKQLNNFRYNARYNQAFFGEIVEITKGKDKYFKTGPCILITSNKAFLDAFMFTAKTLKEKEFKGDKKFGKKVLAQSLDPTQKGYLINVSSKKGSKGKNATCSVQFDTFGDPTHEFDAEIQDQFEDITKAYCPAFGLDNDNNGRKIIEHYKEMIADKSNLVEPDVENEEKSEFDKKMDGDVKELENPDTNLDDALEAAGK